MKKVFAVILSMILLLIGCTASADVLSADWKSASDEELSAALTAINAEIAARKASVLPTDEPITLTGSGTAIEALEIPYAPARLIITAKAAARITITLNGSSEGYSEDYPSTRQYMMPIAGSYTFMAETDDDWSVSVEPMRFSETLPSMQGNGYTYSDLFALDAPVIVHLSTTAVNPDRFGTFYVYLFYHTEYGWNQQYDSSVMEFLSSGDQLEKDLILKPCDGADMYVIRVEDNCGVEWSITGK